MPEQSVIHNTFVIERNYSVPAERVYAALSDPAIKRRWFGEGSSLNLEVFESDFQVGGRERAVYRFGLNSPFPGIALTNEGTYRDIVPNRRIVQASSMAVGDKRISVALATFEILPTEKGADLIFTHQAAFFEGADGPEMRQAGWNTLFGKLDKEVAA